MYKKLLKKGHLNFLMDGSFGSSGKGKMSSYLVSNPNEEKVDYLVTSNSANASHTVIENGKEYCFKVLPSASIHHESLIGVYITSGSSFDVESLFKEIEMIGISHNKVFISPRAGIITQLDKDFESGKCDLDGTYFHTIGDGTTKTGTTASGSGSVLAKKTVRNKTLVVASDIAELDHMISAVDNDILQLHHEGKTGLFEIGQGYPLSNNHPLFAPHTTSRNVTVTAALNDAFLPVYVAGNVILNFRTYPIKIHSKRYISTEDKVMKYVVSETPDKSGGLKVDQWIENRTNELELLTPVRLALVMKRIEAYHHPYHKVTKVSPSLIEVKIAVGEALSWDEVQSGDFKYEVKESNSGDFYPDSEEISWEELSEKSGQKVFECTTLTKLPRRVATFSKMNVTDAIIHNHAGHETFITMNFINYVDSDMTDRTGLTENITTKTYDWIEENMSGIITGFKSSGINVELALLGTGAETNSMIDLLN